MTSACKLNPWLFLVGFVFVGLAVAVHAAPRERGQSASSRPVANFDPAAVRDFLTRIQGEWKGAFYFSPPIDTGSVHHTQAEGGLGIRADGEKGWSVGGGFCTPAPRMCGDSVDKLRLKSDDLFRGTQDANTPVRVIHVSASRLEYRYEAESVPGRPYTVQVLWQLTDDGRLVHQELTLASGQARVNLFMGKR